VVIFGHLSLTFKDLDQNSWLIISISGKGLSFLGGDGCVSWNKNSHDSTSRFNTQGQRSYIQQK
jgi:hypothetical protein